MPRSNKKSSNPVATTSEQGNTCGLSNTATPNPDLLTSYEGLVSELKRHAWTPAEAENFDGTAMRVLKMHRELCSTQDQTRAILNEQFQKVFPTESAGEHGMVIQGPITLNSCCPHHLMPVRYKAYVAYLPKQGRVTHVFGLSKPTRVMQAVARRMVLQETLGDDLATLLWKPQTLPLFAGHTPEFDVETDGAICALVGVHCCMSCRGVNSDSKTMTVSRRGAFADDSTLESRFMQSIGIINSVNPFGG